MSDPVQTTSDSLCDLVRWAHSHGTICSLIPGLHNLAARGSYGNVLITRGVGGTVPVAAWGCSAGHAYHWPFRHHDNSSRGSADLNQKREKFVRRRQSNGMAVRACEMFDIVGCDSDADSDYEPCPPRKRVGTIKQEATPGEDYNANMMRSEHAVTNAQQAQDTHSCLTPMLSPHKPLPQPPRTQSQSRVDREPELECEGFIDTDMELLGGDSCTTGTEEQVTGRSCTTGTEEQATGRSCTTGTKEQATRRSCTTGTKEQAPRRSCTTGTKEQAPRRSCATGTTDKTTGEHSELEQLRALLCAERSRNQQMTETISSLEQDKELLQSELTKKAELICNFLQDKLRPEKRLTPSSNQMEAGSSHLVSLDDVAGFDSPALFDSFEEVELHPLDHKRSLRCKRSRDGENTRVRMKNVGGVIARYMAALQEFRSSVSMKVAFDRVGVDRNTISRTAAIAELSLAAPEVFHALAPWDEKEETLAHYAHRCRQAMDDNIKAKIKAMKAKGELLPILSK